MLALVMWKCKDKYQLDSRYISLTDKKIQLALA